MNMKARSRSSQQQLKMKEIDLTQRSSLEYLGIELDDNLNFGNHIQKTFAQI